jgi:hypothetical protein
MMERSEIVDRLWAAAEPIVYVPKEFFVKNLDDWDLKTVDIGGVPAFATAQRGAEFHIESLGSGQSLTPKIVWNFLRPIIEQHGCARTKTPKDDARQHRFNRILGFHVVGSDEYDIHYQIDRVRGAPCQ